MIFQNAYAQAVQGTDNNKWIVYSKEGEKVLALDAKLSSQEAMNFIHSLRKHETDAFNEGVEEGLRRGKAAADLRVGVINAQMNSLANENERLSEILESKIC